MFAEDAKIPFNPQLDAKIDDLMTFYARVAEMEVRNITDGSTSRLCGLGFFGSGRVRVRLAFPKKFRVGFLVRAGPWRSGRVRVFLISVTRKSGRVWPGTSGARVGLNPLREQNRAQSSGAAEDSGPRLRPGLLIQWI